MTLRPWAPLAHVVYQLPGDFVAAPDVALTSVRQVAAHPSITEKVFPTQGVEPNRPRARPGLPPPSVW